MADRNFQKKKRNDVRRKRRPVLIFTGEGKNKTEKQYFLSFQEQHGKYSIQFVNTGFDTDPRGMLKSMESAWKRYELSAKNGDKAYIVLDMDCNPRKVKLVKELEGYCTQVVCREVFSCRLCMKITSLHAPKSMQLILCA